MENEPPEQIPPELQVWVDSEIVLEGRNAPTDHLKIENALAGLPGIGSLNFLEDRIAIRYDPERITCARLCEIIGQAGFQVSGVESASSDPVVDSHADGGQSD